MAKSVPGKLQTCPCALKPTGAIVFNEQLVLSAGHSSGATMIASHL